MFGTFNWPVKVCVQAFYNIFISFFTFGSRRKVSENLIRQNFHQFVNLKNFMYEKDFSFTFVAYALLRNLNKHPADYVLGL